MIYFNHANYNERFADAVVLLSLSTPGLTDHIKPLSPGGKESGWATPGSG